VVPYYIQRMKQENEDDNEISWKSLSLSEQKNYKKMRKEVS